MKMEANFTDILFKRMPGIAGDIACILLNRPERLNSLDLAMCQALQQQLAVWDADQSIKAIVIRGAGEKAFCAGGDVKNLYYQCKDAENIPAAMHFFHTEYQLNYQISTLKTPYIALLDGIAMGGGLGISLHGSHVVFTEYTQLAMPEAAIGFFPDVGAAYFLSHCSQPLLGLYLALTAQRFNAADSLAIGLGQYYVPRQRLSDCLQALSQADFTQIAETGQAAVSCLLEKYSETPGVSNLPISDIQDIFSLESVKAIVSKLEKTEQTWHQKTASLLRQLSPTSLTLTFLLYHLAKQEPLKDCLLRDYRVAYHAIHGFDFFEGVRCKLIEKTALPHWEAPFIEAVDLQSVAALYLAGLPEDEGISTLIL